MNELERLKPKLGKPAACPWTDEEWTARVNAAKAEAKARDDALAAAKREAEEEVLRKQLEIARYERGEADEAGPPAPLWPGA